MAIRHRSLKDCLGDVKRTAKGVGGREMTDAEALRVLEAIDTRLRLKKGAAAFKAAEARAAEAAGELAEEAAQAALIERRNAYLNLNRRISRRAFYEAAPAAGKDPGYVVGLYAKLVGSARLFAGSRLSVEAEGRALTRDYVVGLVTDLERAGLFETVRSGTVDRAIARELFELSRGENGKPGVTGNPQVLEIAQALHRYQRLSVDRLNDAGAWIGSYDGYVSRTAHDPDKIRRAGFAAWRESMLATLDQERTLAEVADPEKFLRGVYNALITGRHFTPEGMQGFKDPAFTGPGNLAERLSQGRVLHFKSAESWMDYQAKFGQGTLIESILQQLTQAARNTALMRQFGTNPRAELEADLKWLGERFRDTDPEGVIRLDGQRNGIMNRFAELDGTAMMPVNRLGARISSGIRTVESMAKLGGVLLSSINDTVLKASELKLHGVGFLEGYADGLQAIGRGRGNGETREIMDLLRAGGEGMSRSIAARFDPGDTAPGTLSKIANTFFKLTGLTYWTDAQRAGAELVLARHLGKHQAIDGAALPPELSRNLQAFGIGPEEWNALRQVEWKQADGRAYLTPDAATRLSDEQTDHLLRLEAGQPGEQREIRPADRDRLREDLALKLHAYIADVGEAAVLQPGANERAILRRGTQPGTVLGEALRFVGQFKAFPVAVVTKVWARQIHGQDGYGAIAGIVHLIVAGAAMGYVSMAAKDLAKGRTPRDPADPKTWLAALAQGGGAGIYGDYLFGEYSRFGRSALASLAGPVFGQVDDIAELYNRARSGDDPRAQFLKWAVGNTPFANLFYTRAALDYLVLYQVQEALNPGFLRRMERRIEKENAQTFWLRPSEVVR